MSTAGEEPCSLAQAWQLSELVLEIFSLAV